MTELTWLFAILSAACVILIGVEVVVGAIQRLRAPAPAQQPPQGGGLGGATPQSLDIVNALGKMGEVAEQFRKAGPVATLAVLALSFALLALLASGIIKVSAG